MKLKAVQFKRKLQAAVEEKLKGMSNEEIIEHLRRNFNYPTRTRRRGHS